MGNTPKNLLIMFVKEPKLDFVKTRLAKSLGNHFTLDLYKAFVRDLIDTFKNQEFDFKLCAYPNLDLINDTFGDFNNFLQVEGDLGVKMCKAFEREFGLGYEKITLIGSDTPHITREMMDSSFKELDSHDIVLGPSLDGGYYLIAFNKSTFSKDVFQDISWSTDVVLEQTLKKMNNKKVYLHKILNDIDVLEDLKSFYAEFSNSSFENSSTIKLLNQKKYWQSLEWNTKGNEC